MSAAHYDTAADPFGLDDESPESLAIQADADTEYGLLVALIKARTRLKMTQRDVAEHLGVSQSVISDMERGATELKMTTALEYARAVDQELTIRLNNRDVRHALPTWRTAPAAGQPDNGKVIKLASHQRWHMNPSRSLQVPSFERSQAAL